MVSCICGSADLCCALPWCRLRAPRINPLCVNCCPHGEDEAFTCAGCDRVVPWWFGAADDAPELCDDCAIKGLSDDAIDAAILRFVESGRG